ncbi:hypothetical protein MY4038_007992 [Beauveria bassiana]
MYEAQLTWQVLLLSDIRNMQVIGFCCVYFPTGPDAKTVPWSDIEKQLKAGAAPGKSQQECARDGIEVFQKCRAEACEFAECDEKATAAIKSCQGLQ